MNHSPPSETPPGDDRSAADPQAPGPGDVLEIASSWHTRWEDGLDADETAELQRWLCSSPAHAQAFLDAQDMMQALRGLPGQDKARLRAQSVPSRTDPTPRPAFPAAARLPRWLARPGAALACAAVLAAGLGWHLWLQGPQFSDSYVTARGQRLDKALPEGTLLALDSDSGTEVRLYRDRREVRLAQGQAMFSVSADSQRPFVVLAGPARISVVGTRFSVRYLRTGADAGTVSVAVEQGRVQVDGSRAGASGTQELTAGQGISVSASGSLGEVISVPHAGVAPWRKGLIHFASISLANALDEFERYGPTGLVIKDPAVAALALGGSYPINRPDHFARLLPQVLPVRLVALPDGRTEIVQAR